MRRVFVDTGGIVALLVAEDRMHERAAAVFETAAKTNAVIVETHSVLLARAQNGRAAGMAFLDAVQGSSDALAVERVGPLDESKAIAILRAHTDKSYSLCDALSFVVMERLGIAEVLAFDRHFSQYGRFSVLG